jgi:acetyl-CoA carboxylase carboxyl transferase subunit alpha
VFNRKVTPPDAPKGEIVAQGREWLETILSRFGPIRDRAQTVTTLDFEKPLLELDKRIKEVGHNWPSLTRNLLLGLGWWILFLTPAQVRKVAEDNGVDVTPQIAELEQRARQVGWHHLHGQPPMRTRTHAMQAHW